jgi:hypothetical protein
MKPARGTQEPNGLALFVTASIVAILVAIIVG